MIYLTRRYRFPAAHILSQASFGDAENRRIFGKCANPNGHGHDYIVDVSVTGPVDGESGEIVPIGLLDRIFDERVARRFAHRMLNEVEPFDRLVPTAENIAQVIHAGLAADIAGQTSARLAHVHVIETANNYVDYGEMS